MEVQLHPFSPLMLYWVSGQLNALAVFTLGKEFPGTQTVRGWVRPRATGCVGEGICVFSLLRIEPLFLGHFAFILVTVLSYASSHFLC